MVKYVDGFVIRRDEGGIKDLRFIEQKFHTKKLGLYFLGIEVAQSKKEIFLFQRKYVLNMLSEADC